MQQLVLKWRRDEVKEFKAQEGDILKTENLHCLRSLGKPQASKPISVPTLHFHLQRPGSLELRDLVPFIASRHKDARHLVLPFTWSTLHLPPHILVPPC
jgi:hypothetical protein